MLVKVEKRTPLRLSHHHSWKRSAGPCTPTFELYQQIHTHSLQAAERHSGKGRESLTGGEADEKVGTSRDG